MNKIAEIIFIVIVIVVVALTAYPLHASQEYIIDTKYGTEKVIIPDGYSLEDVLLKVATAYYEQNHEYNELQDKVNKLTDSTSLYIEDNKALRTKYNNLVQDYDLLVKKIESYNNMGGFIRGFAGAHYLRDFNNNSNGGGINLGVILWNRVMLEAGLNYPWGMSIGASYVF